MRVSYAPSFAANNEAYPIGYKETEMDEPKVISWVPELTGTSRVR